MAILAVTGLTKEAEIVSIAGVIAVAGGGDAKSLAQKLEALHGDIQGVISIGLGGALAPQLKVGEVVIAERALYEGRLGDKGESYACDEAWRVRLAARLPGAHSGPVLGSDTIIEDTDAK